MIRLVVMPYVRSPLSLRNVEDLLLERGIDISHETVRHWWNRFGRCLQLTFAGRGGSRMRGFRHWRWHLDEMYARLNGEMVYLWRAVDHEREIPESYVTRTRDKADALRFMKKALKRHGPPEAITTDGLRSYGAAMDELGNREEAGGRPLGQQSGGELASAIPTTRTGDAEVPADEEPAEVASIDASYLSARLARRTRRRSKGGVALPVGAIELRYLPLVH